MLNLDGNENGIKIKRSNQQNTNLHVQHTFSLISKKTNLHEQQAFLFLCRCFAQLQRCFVGLNRQTSQLHIICLPNILSRVFMFAFIFHCPSFSPCWAFLAGHQHFSLSRRRLEFLCFSSYRIRLQLFLCYPRECKHQK